METYFAKFIVRCSEHLTIGKNRISFVNEIQDIPLTAASSKSNRITSYLHHLSPTPFCQKLHLTMMKFNAFLKTVLFVRK